MNRKIIMGVIMVSVFLMASFVSLSDNVNNYNNHYNIKSSNENIFDLKPNGKSYYYNNIGVIFSNNKQYIEINNKYYPLQWNIFSMGNLHVEKLKL